MSAQQTPLVRLNGRLGDPEATDRLGAALGEALAPGDAVTLYGGLGAGKSALARAAIRRKLALEGRAEEAPSPTYTLVQTYETRDGPLRHADLYRLSTVEEIEEIGLFEAADSAVLLIEWPDRLGEMLPERRLEIRLEIEPGDGAAPETRGRLLEARFFGQGWRRVEAALQDALDAAGRTEARREGDGA